MNTAGRGSTNPRTIRVRELILNAAIDLLLDGGAGDVTATRIAEQTGVARTTVYRQWPDQASLLLATIDALVAPHAPTTTTGELPDDLTTVLTSLRTRLVTREVRPVFAALVDHASRDEAFVAVQRRFVEGMVRPTMEVLADARERGDLPLTVDCSTAASVLTGPLFHQHLSMQEPIDDDLIDRVVSQFIEFHRDAAADTTARRRGQPT